MDSNSNETNLTIKIRKYNGKIAAGSILMIEHQFIAQKLIENNHNGMIKYCKNIEFCCDEQLGANPSANIKIEIPYLVESDKINTFNNLINQIQNDPNYVYNETHYSKDGFDPKRLNYMDIIINNQEYETDDENIFNTLNDIVNIKECSDLMEEFYQKLSQLKK